MESNSAIPEFLHLAKDHKKTTLVVHLYSYTFHQCIRDPPYGG